MGLNLHQIGATLRECARQNYYKRVLPEYVEEYRRNPSYAEWLLTRYYRWYNPLYVLGLMFENIDMKAKIDAARTVVQEQPSN